MNGQAGGRTIAWEIAAVVVVAGVAAALRLYRLDLGWFGVDQARDIATALDIAAGREFPAVGPTMRRVARLGAFYYYYWTLPYLVWRDPIAGYWFAALLAIAALGLLWWTARRLWGPLPALVALAAGAVNPVWVIDSRVCWAPAALPAIAALILWIALGGGTRVRFSTRRMALLGVTLALAIQLHLTMIAWVVAAAAVALWERPPWRALAAGALGFAVTALPALWALLANPEGGVAALAARAPPAPAARLLALLALPLRVPTAFSQWSDHDPRGGPLVAAAALALSALALAGMVRLGARALAGEDSARVLVTVVLATVAMLVTMPGEAWYYYADGLLPLWALAAGALAAPRSGARGLAPRSEAGAPPVGRTADPWARGAPEPGRGQARRAVGAPAAVAAVTVLTALVLTVRMATWLSRVERSGYVPLEPTLLNLDGRAGHDAPVAGKLLTTAVKRAVAMLAVTPGAGFEAFWQRVHGPAFADATGDNGFWLRWSAERAPWSRTAIEATLARANAGVAATAPLGIERPSAAGDRERPGVVDGGRASDAGDPAAVISGVVRPRRSGTRADHVAIWYRDDPIAVALAAAAPAAAGAVEATIVGPLLVVRYRPALAYASCLAGGRPIAVPVRIVPRPERYGDGTPEMPRLLPTAIDCTLARGSGWTRVVASLGGNGTVTLSADGERRSAPGRESVLCVPRAETPARIRVEIHVPPGEASDLDLYDVPLGVGCPP